MEKDVDFRFDHSYVEAFEASKKLLLSNKVPTHFDVNKRLVVSCDSSSYGVGAVLSHREMDRTERPVCFVSSTLSKAEQNYSQLEREDHQPLRVIFNPD